MKIVSKTEITRNSSFDNFEDFKKWIEASGLKTIVESMKENKSSVVIEKSEIKIESDKIEWKIDPRYYEKE